MKVIALTLGDRYGVGSEIVARMLADLEISAEVATVVVGDEQVFARGCRIARVNPHVIRIDDLRKAREPRAGAAFLNVPYAAAVELPGHVSREAGREVLEVLTLVAEAAREGDVDGIVYAPLNKQAMADAGHAGADEAEFFGRMLGGEAGEINVLDSVSTSRVTSHVPISAVAGLITEESVWAAIQRMHGFLVRSGRSEPKLAVAGLNPHAGEGGVLGREEMEIIGPAIARAKASGIGISGPFPADTVFLRAFKGDYDAVVTMYHDQGQIALKLVGLGRGVTVIAGLSVPIVTAGHGTAFDIAGRGIADIRGMQSAHDLCCRLIGVTPEPVSPAEVV